jgi:L-alanine-DL-glutamate epimerase-like enolase superfamily enzyme
MQGDSIVDPIVRIYTDTGLIGWARSTAGAPHARLLVGKCLADVFDPERGTALGYEYFDLPLWDLAGRVVGKSVHALLGSKGKKLVSVYDSSIYFEDLDPQTGKDRGLEPVEEAVHQGLGLGYRAFKLKIGRGQRWMERQSGFKRDIEVITRVREVIGNGIPLLIDSNNTFTPEEARALVEAVSGCSPYWFEEPFPEDMETSLAFKRFLHEKNPKILLADGEGTRPHQREILAVLRAGAIDVVQFDLRPCPISAWLPILPLLEEVGIMPAPHNWASFLLNFCVPHMGRGIANFSTAETDPSTMEGVDASRYRLVDGKLEIPDDPGFGLELDHAAVDRLVNEEGWSVGD